MLLVELDAYPMEQMGVMERIERRQGLWAAGRTIPWRFMAYSRSFDMGAPRRQLAERRMALGALAALREAVLPTLTQMLEGDERARAALPALIASLTGAARTALEALSLETMPSLCLTPTLTTEAEWLQLGDVLEQRTWSLPYLRDMELFYADLAARRLRSATYVMVLWPPPEVQAVEVIAGLRMATGRDVRQIEHLPSVLQGAVTVDEGRALMRPVAAGQPYLRVLRAYDITGTIDAGLLHVLMDLPFDLTIAVDVETMPQAKARRVAEQAYRTARAVIADVKVKDTRSEEKAQDAERVMRAVREGEALHLVQLAVLVSAENEEELRQRSAAVRDLLGGTVRFEAVRGCQAELLKLFSTLPAHQIDAAWARSAMLSHGVGCMLGLLGYYRAATTAGALWGLDALRSAPLFYDLFAGGQAGHMIVLGQTGSGKTFFLNVMTLRVAAALGWRVIWIDSNENGPRLKRALGDGMTRHEIGLSSTINLLEPVYGPEDGPHWISSQAQHITSSLALLMGDPELTGGEASGLRPRTFSIEERAMLERALLTLYADMPDDPEPDEVPILTDLIRYLEAIEEPEALAMARLLRMQLFGSATRTDTQTVRGRCFNGPTTVDWNIDADVTCFDLTQGDSSGKEILPFFYALNIGVIFRFMRDRRRDRRRPTLLIIDEFGLASQIESVGRLAATIARVARKYRLALVLADQTPQTFLKKDFGRVILDNAPAKILFHMDQTPTREIGAALPVLTETHLQFIQEVQQGAAVAVFGQNVTAMVVEPTSQELSMLRGS